MGTSRLDLIQRYFALLESFSANSADFEPFVHPEMVQEEFPNSLNRNGQRSDFADFMRRAALGKKTLSRQSYEITNVVESSEQMVVETIWKGTLAITAGPFKAGQEIKARFCIVCEFKDGRLYRQRNYDCFEPF